jgi:hypothetical protein
MEIEELLNNWEKTFSHGPDNEHQRYERIEEHTVTIALGSIWWDITLTIYVQMDTPVVISIADVKKSP